MPIDRLSMMPSPLGLDESAEALAGIEPDCLLCIDDTDTMVVLVYQLEGQPLLQITLPRPITDWNEMIRLLPENSQPPSRCLIYRTELHSPSSTPETAGRIVCSLAQIMDGWIIPFSGGQE